MFVQHDTAPAPPPPPPPPAKSPAVPEPGPAKVARTAAGLSNSANDSVAKPMSPEVPEPAPAKVARKEAASSSNANDGVAEPIIIHDSDADSHDSVAEPIIPTPKADALLKCLGDTLDENPDNLLEDMARKLWYANLATPPPNYGAPTQWERVPLRKVCTPFLREAVLHNLRCRGGGGSKFLK